MARYIYIASDFHMGDGGPRDDFLERHSTKLELDVAELQDVGDRLVILAGDVIDGTRYGIAKCIEAHRSDLHNLLSLRPLWLVGNHDLDVLKPDARLALEQMGARFCFRAFAGRGTGGLGDVGDGVYLCHGHEFDDFNSRWRWVGETATKAVSAVGRVWPKAEDWLSGLAGKAEAVGNRQGRHADHDAFAARAASFASGMLGCRAVITGHTHRSAVPSGTAAFHYINSGTYQNTGWLRIDLQSMTACRVL